MRAIRPMSYQAFTLGVPSLQAPKITSAIALSETSAQLTWTGPIQTLTLGGDFRRHIHAGLQRHTGHHALTRTDEVQKLAVSSNRAARSSSFNASRRDAAEHHR